MSRALDEALAIARERLEHDADAYADQDIIGRLVEAIEGDGYGQTAAAPLLLNVARHAAGHAARLAEDPSASDAARTWADAARIALEGWRIAPIYEEPGDDEARAEFERAATAYRERIAGHEALLVELAQTFGSAKTATASRIAGRIERHLQGFGVEVPHGSEHDEEGKE